MNLILLRGGYVPVAVRPEDRHTYLAALETASLTGDMSAYELLMLTRLRDTLTEYIQALNQTLPYH